MIQSANPPATNKNTLSGLHLFAEASTASTSPKEGNPNISEATIKRLSHAKNVLRACGMTGGRTSSGKNVTAQAAALFATGTEEAESLEATATSAAGEGQDAKPVLTFDATKLATKALAQHPQLKDDDEINALAATPGINDLALKLVEQKKTRASMATEDMDDINVEEEDAAKSGISAMALQLVCPTKAKASAADDIDVEEEDIDVEEEEEIVASTRPSKVAITRANSTISNSSTNSSKRERGSPRKTRCSKSPHRNSRTPPPNMGFDDIDAEEDDDAATPDQDIGIDDIDVEEEEEIVASTRASGSKIAMTRTISNSSASNKKERRSTRKTHCSKSPHRNSRTPPPRTGSGDIGLEEDEEVILGNEKDNDGDDNVFSAVDIDEDSDDEITSRRQSRSSTSSKREPRLTGSKPRCSILPARITRTPPAKTASRGGRSPPPKTNSRSRSPPPKTNPRSKSPPRTNSSGIRQRASHRGHCPRKMSGALSEGNLPGIKKEGPAAGTARESLKNATFVPNQQRPSVSPPRASVCPRRGTTALFMKTEQIAHAQLRKQSICVAAQQQQLVQDLEALEAPPAPAEVKYKGLVSSYSTGKGTGAHPTQAEMVAAAHQATDQASAHAHAHAHPVARASIMAPMVNAAPPKRKKSGAATRSGAACGPPTKQAQEGEFADLESSFLTQY